MTFDVFISYPRADRDRVVPLYDALTARGMSVWKDDERIEEGGSISRSVTEGLSRSRLMLAWCSPAYVQSRACQWELTAAVLTAGNDQGTTVDWSRLLLIDAGAGVARIEPEYLRDQLLPDPGRTPEELADLVARRLEKVPSGPLRAIRPLDPPPWVGGSRRLGSNRFVGRLRSLWTVHAKLTGGGVAAIVGLAPARGVMQVQGMGGIGKSLLAEEYALRFGAFHPGGIVWLSARGATGDDSDTVRERQYYDVAVALQLPIQGLKPEEVIAAVAAHLAQRAPYLWVVDDLPADAGIDTLHRWQAPTANGRSLITTRSQRLDGSGDTLSLGVLDPDDALRLLTGRRSPANPAEHETAAAIVEALGCHALAVDVAGAAVRDLGYAAFLAKLRNPSRDAMELAAKLAPDLPTGHHASIAVTLLESIERLNDDGRAVLELASLLAAEPIPKDFITAVFAHLSGDGDSGLERMSLGLKAAIDESLAERTDDDGVSVHVLVSRTLRLHAPAAAAMRDAAVFLLNVAMSKAADIRNHTALQGLVPHARLLTDTLPDATTASLLGWLARFDLERGAFATAAVDYRRQWDARVALLGAEHPNTLIAMANLAGTLLDQGDLGGARVLQERVLDLRRRLRGEEHPDTLTAMANLAEILRSQGDLGGARALQERVLDLLRRLLGEEHPDTLTAMNNLAGTLQSQGDLDGARALEERVLDLRRRLLGEEHPDTLTAMNNLAETLRSQGDLGGARALQEHVLDLLRRLLDDEHPNTLTAMNNLAETLRSQGDLGGARALQEHVLDLLRRLLDDEHPNTLTAMNNLAETLRSQGDLGGARALQERVLDLLRRLLGEEHLDTLTAMNNLAGTLRSQGDLGGARALQERVLNLRRRLLGEEHPDTLTAMNNLAATLLDQGDLGGARGLQKRVLDLRRRLLGEEHPDTLTAMSNLAAPLYGQGDLDGAEKLLTQALTVAQRKLGPTHPTTLQLRRNLAVLQSQRPTP